MFFNRLHLKNFKSHEDTVIDFNPGITLIVGENGAGKSTILEGISFALFKQHNSKTIRDLVRSSKGSSAGTMSVTLEFTSNGNHYKVERTHTKSSSKAILYQKIPGLDEDGYGYQIICENDKTVNAEIQSILEIDADLFLNAIYIRQGEIAELVSKTPSEKKKLIAKLLGIDSLEKAWENIKPLISNYEKEEAELKGRLSKKDDVDTQIKDLKLQNYEMEANKLELDGEIKQTQKIRDELAKRKETLEENRIEYNNLKNRLDTEKEDIKRLKTEKNDLQLKLDKINMDEKEANRLEKYAKKLPVYEEFYNLSMIIKKLQLDKESFEEDLNKLSRQKELIKKYETVYDTYNKIGDELENLYSKKSKIDTDYQSYLKEQDDVEKLKKDLADNKELLSKFNDKLVSTIEKETKYKDINDKTPEETRELLTNLIEGTEESLNEIDQDINRKKEEIASSKVEIQSSQKPLDELKDVGNKCPICQSDISNQKKLDLEKLYKEKIVDSQNKINRDNKDIAILAEKKKIIKNKNRIFNDLSKEFAANEYLIKDISEENTKIKEMEKDIASRKPVENEVTKVNQEIGEIKEKRKSSKEGYDKYINALNLIEDLPNENEIKNRISQNRDELDHIVRKIKIAMNKDSHLSSDISEEELNSRIKDLRKKNDEYNKLKGFIQVKSNYESQLMSKKESLNFKENNVLKYEKDIRNINYDEEKYNTTVKNLTLKDEKLINLNKDSSKIDGQLKIIKSNLESLIKEQTDYKTLVKNYEDTQTFIDYLRQIRKLFSKDGIQEDLRKLSRPTIQKYTKEFFEEFNFDYSDLILDDDFNVSLYGPEGESSLDMVSGGEKIAIALALRLGITKSMSNGIMETILLDEPTIHLDSYRRHELIDLLRKMSTLPQMIIVTHDEELESAADTIIKIRKELGVSKVADEE